MLKSSINRLPPANIGDSVLIQISSPDTRVAVGMEFQYPSPSHSHRISVGIPTKTHRTHRKPTEKSTNHTKTHIKSHKNPRKPHKNPQNPHVGTPIGLKSFPFPSHMGIPMGKPTDSHFHGNPAKYHDNIGKQ